MRQKPLQTIEESIVRDYKYFMLAPTVENIKDVPQIINNKIIVTHKESFDVMKKN